MSKWNQSAIFLRTISVLTFLCAYSLMGHAQLKADFEADTLQFCPPYTVNFLDKSSGGRIISRRWEFGQGGVSNNNNPFPSASYTSAGLFNVKLVVSDGTNTDSVTKTAYIHAFQKPQADFSTVENPSGCAPLDLNFRNNTRIGDAPLATTQWNFGDGYRSSQNTPRHNYTFAGKYTVVLKVVDTNGCSNTIRKNSFVDAIQPPTARFTANPSPSSCQAPHTVTFANQSFGRGRLSYSWNLGNSITSTAVQPTQTYGAGAYDITLIVTDSAGCTDTLEELQYVTVGSAKADFSMLDTFCVSDTNLFRFRNLSIGSARFLWTFGDGGYANARHPVHQYKTPGTYKVTLTIGNGTPCSDSISKTVTVIQPKAWFTTNLNYWCQDTMVEFTPHSDFPLEAKYARWRYQYRKKPWPLPPIVPIGMDSIRKVNRGWHLDTLDIFFPKWGSCRAQIIDSSINIWYPSGNIFVSPDEGCVPLTAYCRDSLWPRDSLTGGYWTFDATQVVPGRTASKTYTTHGYYSVKYNIKHKRGCEYEYGPLAVATGIKPTADFTIDSNEVCAGSVTLLKNRSTDSNLITGYYWVLDHTRGFPTSNLRNPPATYVDTGYKTVFLRVNHNGCKDSIVKPNFLKVNGPLGQIKLDMDCDTPFKRTFSPNNWIGVQRFKYLFGDGVGVDSINPRTSYTYASRGNYLAQLALYNDSNGCDFIADAVINIRDLNLKSTIDTVVGCFPSEFTFRTDSSQDIDFLEVNAYSQSTQYLNDSSFIEFKVNSLAKGPQWVMIVAHDENGCTDTSMHWIKTYLPDVRIASAVDSGCSPLSVVVYDSTRSDTALVSRLWTSASGNAYNDSVPMFFSGRGKHSVILKVRDTLGCESSTMKIFDVFTPEPQIVVDTQLCVNDTVVFTNSGHRGGEIHTWNFGDSLTGSGDVPRTVYNKPGRKSIRLYSVDHLGCDTVVYKPLWVDVQEVLRPQVLSLPSDTSCYPAEIDFEVQNPDTTVQFFFWRFDTADAYIRTAGPLTFYNYTKPGVYGMTIRVESTYGCVDSFQVDSIVTIGGPYARFDLPDTFCMDGLSTVRFRDKQDVFQFRFDFGDGTVDTLPGTADSVQHVYGQPGLLPVSLIFTDTTFKCVKSWSDTVFVQQVEALIQIADTMGCEPFNLQAGASSTSVDQYMWYLNGKPFGQGQTIDDTLKGEGEYHLVLIPLNTSTGCSDTAAQKIQIYSKPKVDYSGGGVYCYNADSTAVFLSGAEKYLWIPKDFINQHTEDTVLLKPDRDISYQVVGLTSKGCNDTVNIDYKVVHKPGKPEIEDTLLYEGQEYRLQIPFSSSLRYSWNPSFNLSCSTCPDPIVYGRKSQDYTLTIRDSEGCFEVKSSFSVRVSDDYRLYIPNAFTPNDDGDNDIYRFYAHGFEEMTYFKIYDRWGEEVYSFSDMEDEWDGNYRGQPYVDNAKLVYRGQFVKFNGEVVDVTGFVVILR